MSGFVDPLEFTCMDCGNRFPWCASVREADRYRLCRACMSARPATHHAAARHAKPRRRCVHCGTGMHPRAIGNLHLGCLARAVRAREAAA